MDGVNFFDAGVMAFVQQHLRTGFGDGIFTVITYLGEAGAFWLALGAILLIPKKTRKCGFCMLCAIALGFLIGELTLKNIVCRPRPYVSFPDYTTLLVYPSGYSFPSGHSCSSFAGAVVLFRFSKKWGTPALVLAALIAFSRVYCFVHWPSDILCGAALGIACALTVLWVKKKLEEKQLRGESNK